MVPLVAAAEVAFVWLLDVIAAEDREELEELVARPEVESFLFRAGAGGCETFAR